MKKTIIFLLITLMLAALGLAIFTVFFDQAVIVRRDTIYRINALNKVAALTFDDGPSPAWTPKILDELKKAGVKATFFMLGEYVAKYPGIARRVAEEGHEIGNHTFTHHGLIYYKKEEIKKEIDDAEEIIRKVTGKKTVYFRPPKAWITGEEKEQVEKMGYKTILWTLNSKDWVNFDDKYIVKYLMRHIRPGDIILFHDGGGVFSTEGGNREETVKAIPLLVSKLKEKGYKFVTISELLNTEKGRGKN